MMKSNCRIFSYLTLLLSAFAFAACNHPLEPSQPDCGFIPKTGSTYTFSVTNGKDSSIYVHSITSDNASTGDSTRVQVAYISPSGFDGEFELYYASNGNVWRAESDEEYVGQYYRYLPFCSRQSTTYPTTRASYTSPHWLTSQGRPSTVDVTKTLVITYMGSEKIVVGGETLLCEHVRSELRWKRYNPDATPREWSGIRAFDYWFAPSIGYFVKVAEGEWSQTLIAYKLAQ